jgi:hypothetical protein
VPERVQKETIPAQVAAKAAAETNSTGDLMMSKKAM